VIERRKTRRLGSTREYPVGARFVAATNRDLPEMIARGAFRSDLYYRLNVVSLSLPPLRERGEDILLLARHFATQTARRYGLTPIAIDADALQALTAYAWPGNVRELKHLIERALLLARDHAIGADDLALDRSAADQRVGGFSAIKGMTLEGAERFLIEQALRECDNNVSEAARRVGVSRMAMRYRIEKYGLEKDIQ
jgi:two-component system, NtrC family, response regulator AtoC